MFAQTYGSTTVALNGVLIAVEVDLSNGIPGLDIVGLPDAAVREARERVRAAIKNSGFEFPARRITINLAPADLRKDSSGLDLPIAVGILCASGQLKEDYCRKCLFIGELSLEGKVRGIAGILPMAINSLEHGITELFVAPENAQEALLAGKLTVYAPQNLEQVAAHIKGIARLAPVQAAAVYPNNTISEDFADVQGQFLPKRALEIAAAGGHNLLMVGPPGSGKTMLARRLPSILPPMSRAEALEVTKIYSVAGQLHSHAGLVTERPFRNPHHTVSAAGLTGGGRIPHPGEITLAHHGVLFLDELPEFPRTVLEVLRQPLEDGQVTIARANATLTFPARLMLVCSMNPCPCGFAGDLLHPCSCTPGDIRRYVKKISGPLLDRMDIQVMVPRLEYSEMTNSTPAEASALIRKRVEAARLRQAERLSRYGIFCNAHMGHKHIKATCSMTEDAQGLLKQAFAKMGLSARGYDRIIKVARTIADLDAADKISGIHIAEAIQLRNNLQDIPWK